MSEVKRFGIGFCVIQIFEQPLPRTFELFQGTPRLLVSGTKVAQLTRSGAVLHVEFVKNQMSLKPLQIFVLSECLVGMCDPIPGLQNTYLPALVGDFDGSVVFSKRKHLYCHHVRVSNMGDVEKSFAMYLANMAGAETGISAARVTERKLTVVPHNTWRQIGQNSFISMNLDLKGQIQTSGSIKILDFCMHPLIALLFKLEYRVTLKYANGSERIHDYILGYCIHLPALLSSNADILQQDLNFDLIMGPGISLTGDILWD